MEKTVILNKEECGHTSITTIGKMMFACSLKGGVTRLDIKRVVVVANNSKKYYGFLSRFGLAPAEITFDVDMDLYLTDNSVIEIHSTDPKFLQKMLPYIYELNKNPREEFYGTTKGGQIRRW